MYHHFFQARKTWRGYELNGQHIITAQLLLSHEPGQAEYE